MSTSASPQTLFQLLNREVEQAVSLVHSLQTEHVALTDNDVAAIDNAVHAKQQQVEQFERSERDRTTWLRRAGVTEERSAIREYLAAQPERSDALISLWDRLLELADQCRQQNRTNGALVEVHRRHAQRALDLLRGTQAPATYGPSGEASGREDTHSLAKA